MKTKIKKSSIEIKMIPGCHCFGKWKYALSSSLSCSELGIFEVLDRSTTSVESVCELQQLLVLLGAPVHVFFSSHPRWCSALTHLKTCLWVGGWLHG